jgi:hypothetical protein
LLLDVVLIRSFVADGLKETRMAKLLLFAGLLALACMSQAARLPSDTLSMLDSLPQSMMGFQGAAKKQASNEDTTAAAQVVGSMMGSAAYGDLEVRSASTSIMFSVTARWLHAEPAAGTPACTTQLHRRMRLHDLKFCLFKAHSKRIIPTCMSCR